VLEVRDLSNKAIFATQLNQRYRSSYWYSAHHNLDLVLDGWTVYDEAEPVAPGEQTGEVYRYVGSGRSLSTLPIETELTRLREKIAQDLSVARDASRTEYLQQGSELDAAYGLQRLERFLTDALARFVRVRDWISAAQVCEQACDLVMRLDAADRGRYLGAIVASLRPALADTEEDEGESAFTMRMREDALDRFTAALAEAGAEQEHVTWWAPETASRWRGSAFSVSPDGT